MVAFNRAARLSALFTCACMVLSGCGGSDGSQSASAQTQSSAAAFRTADAASSNSIVLSEEETEGALDEASEAADSSSPVNQASLSPAGKSSALAVHAAASTPTATPVDTTPDNGPPPRTPAPYSRGDGLVAGVPAANGGSVYYCKDALLAGFEWFERLRGWFPGLTHTSAAETPTHQVVNMAYAKTGTMTFKKVVVSSTGDYTMTIRYAFASGLFPGVTDRPMGIAVNGVVITTAMHFPITHGFSIYQHASMILPLKAGQNEIQIFNVTDHGVSRVDTMTIKPI